VGIVASGFYSPWMVKNVAFARDDSAGDAESVG
jgi:hypothetical protein